MSAPSRSDAPLPGYLAAGACTLIWGSNYSIAKRLLLEVDPLAVAWVRAAAGVLFFGLLLAVRDGGRNLPHGLRRAAPLGLLGIFANQILFMTGLKRTSAAHSAILIALLPVFVLLISALGRAERISVPKIAGVLVAFGGATVIALERGVGLEEASATGDLLTLAGVLAFAAYTVLGKPVLRDFGALRATALAFVSGGAGILLVALPAAARQDWRSLSATALACLLAVVALSTLLAYVLYYFAVSRIDPSKVATMMYLQPMVAALVAYFVARDSLNGPFLLGGGLILGGVVLAERG
ncbi:MAG TPA: DMT family transporter [Candidatus Dormibacteraeota bacterium]|nr:DMT family transporter [Candidatus Dormibacteraeota bacterium]